MQSFFSSCNSLPEVSMLVANYLHRYQSINLNCFLHSAAFAWGMNGRRGKIALTLVLGLCFSQISSLPACSLIPAHALAVRFVAFYRGFMTPLRVSGQSVR